jgi:hypothetical protein
MPDNMDPTQLKIVGQAFELPGIVANQTFRRDGGTKGCDRGRLTDITKGQRIKTKDIGMAEHQNLRIDQVRKQHLLQDDQGMDNR